DHRYAEAGKWERQTLPPAPESAAIDVGPEDQLQVDQMRLLRVGDRRLVLARTDQGYVAFDDRCTHKGGPLSDGTLACGRVQCPWHGSQFDVCDGSVQHGPAEEPIASSRLRNSGLKMRSIAAFDRLIGVLASSEKPIAAALISREPAFDVRISTTLRKSALRPVLSVSAAWSITCSRML